MFRQRSYLNMDSLKHGSGLYVSTLSIFQYFIPLVPGCHMHFALDPDPVHSDPSTCICSTKKNHPIKSWAGGRFRSREGRSVILKAFSLLVK